MMHGCRRLLMLLSLAALLAGCTGSSEKDTRKNLDKPVPPTAEQREKTDKK